MRKILAGAIAAVCLSPVALRAEVIRFDIVERLPAFVGRSTELQARPGWAWLRPFRRLDDYERALQRAEQAAAEAELTR